MKMQFHPNRRRWRHLTVALALGAGFSLVLPAASAATASLPMQRHEGNITYLSGGIGAQEAQAIKHAAPNFPLEVEFLRKEADGHAAYLAGDQVTIRNHAGKTVLHTASDGPFLLAKLPPGQYLIRASDGNVSKQHNVVVAAGKHQDVVFEW